MKYISKQELIECRAERWMNATMDVRRTSGTDAKSPSFIVGESMAPGTYFLKIFYTVPTDQREKPRWIMLDFDPYKDVAKPIWGSESTGLIGLL